MRLPEPGSPLRRRLTLAAFILLLALPAPVAIMLSGAVLAIAAVRAARFVTRFAAGRLRAPRREDGIMLGVDARGRLVRLGDDELSAHGLIVGASGAGKTTTLLTILTDQVRRGRPVVAIDMKGSPSFVNELATRRPMLGGRSSSGRSTAAPTGTRSPTATPPSSRTS